MKKLLFLIIFISVGYFGFSQTGMSKPGIRFNTTTFNFDTVPEGPNIRCEFVLYNTGQIPVKIRQVNSSCGCLVFEWPKEQIEPGDSGIIKAVMLTQSRPGPFTKSGTVHLNDSSVYVLILKGYITTRPQMQFREVVWDFREISQNIPVRHAFTFVNTGNSPLIINDVRGSGGGQIAERYTKEPVMPGDTGEVVIVYGAFNPGNFTKTMTVFTNSGDQTLTLRGTVVQATEPNPPVVHPGK